MPRPQKNRLVQQPPLYSSFKPAGIRTKELAQLSLSLDEYEALRLADYLQLDHEESAAKMQISRPTFTRLVERARHKIASFLIEGRALRIEGGSIHFRRDLLRCSDCNMVFPVDFDGYAGNCPVCESENLTTAADAYGHGPCCGPYARQREREQNMPDKEEDS